MNDLSPVRLEGSDVGELRKACFERDGYHCTECGRGVTDFAGVWFVIRAEMAHIQGRGASGADTLDNVRTLCGRCHGDEHHPKVVAAK